MKYAFGREINESTNTKAEALVIVEALRHCREYNYTKIWLQTDSLILKNVITSAWNPPWFITNHIEEILQLLEGCNKMVSHIYREGNKLADHLANYALDVGNIECHEFWQLDIQERRLVNEDKLQCPYLRVKVTKN